MRKNNSGGGASGVGAVGARGTRTRKQRGEVAESVFLAKAVSMGFGVAKPWGDSERYDFILDSGGELWRVQVKSAYAMSKEGGYTVHAHGNENRRPYTKEEVDVLVAYVVPEDAWYVIPIEAFAGIQGMKLFPTSKRRMSRFERYREAWCWMSCGREGVKVQRRCLEGTGCWVKGRKLGRRMQVLRSSPSAANGSE